MNRVLAALFTKPLAEAFPALTGTISVEMNGRTVTEDQSCRQSGGLVNSAVDVDTLKYLDHKCQVSISAMV